MHFNQRIEVKKSLWIKLNYVKLNVHITMRRQLDHFNYTWIAFQNREWARFYCSKTEWNKIEREKKKHTMRKQLVKCVFLSVRKQIGRKEKEAEPYRSYNANRNKWAFNASKRIHFVQLQLKRAIFIVANANRRGNE